MELTLEPADAIVLREVLEQYLFELRGEIGDTEDHDTREMLRQRRAVLDKIVAQLPTSSR
jgi:hypothetical protein